MKVSGRRSGRVSIAGLIALRPGCQTRLCYRIRVHHGRRGERRGLSETDYMRLVDGVHQMLKAPIVLLWDRLNTDVSKVMQRLMAARSWLTVVLLPAYAPELTVYRPATLDGFMAETELGLPPSCPQSAEVSNQPHGHLQCHASLPSPQFSSEERRAEPDTSARFARGGNGPSVRGGCGPHMKMIIISCVRCMLPCVRPSDPGGSLCVPKLVL
ncbi:hypothetical protein ACFY2M_42670 [Streptomyces sp. NPDC001276]|uniref:hypothetical protein n=1 Tax=Streptomyces sp. NPDC001276 TaxID=3364555 RepID=UPI00368A8E2B